MNSQETPNLAGRLDFAGNNEGIDRPFLMTQATSRVKGNSDLTSEFLSVLHSHGLVPSRIIPDGQLHRCNTAGKERGQDGAYILHADHPASGWYRNFRTGDDGTWSAKGGASLTPEERSALKSRIESDRAARQADEARRHAEAKERAKHILAACPPCPADHPYLVKKGVAPEDSLRLAKDGRLVVPVHDEHGEVMTLQFIAPDGGKRFLTGGQVAGGYFAITGAYGPLFIVEGLATGLTVHAATGQSILVTFTCGNLKAVAAMARRMYPTREIIIAADDDNKTEGNPGVTKATEAARAIKGKLAVPKFAEPAGKSDFNDLATAEGLDAVRVQLAEAQEPEPESAYGARKLVVLDVAQFLALDIPRREHILAPVIPTQGLAMLYAPRGVGKTFLALSIAYAVASGQSALRWQAPRPRPVLYIDGEMPAVTMQERLTHIVAGFDQEPPAGFLRIMTPDLQPDFMPNIAAPDGQAALAPALDGVAMVVVDNIATLARHGRENETESWLPVQSWILDLRRRGLSVLLVHHANKSGGQRGTSSREDVLDTVISLRRPSDYQMDEGARFEVHLEKARGIVGKDANPFEATLTTTNAGLVWRTRDIEDMESELVARLHAEGNTVRDIAEELGLSKSKVQRILTRLKEAK